MGKHQKIIQVVGYKNCGKTTLMEALVREFSERNVKVGTIKHHGHEGNPPDVEERFRDHHRHFRQGAYVSSVEGNGEFHMQLKMEESNVKQILSLYQMFPLDLILIEGYKHAPFPKVVLLRSKEDEHLVQSLKNICCVISTEPLTTALPSSCKQFKFDEKEAYIQWICNQMEGS
ncbi:molybdopterin-guanine dinucleotide biosynthesis protein B [Bacillus sp. FJAT-47783]|uniref:molybdopterin-guanine dinucleotide biosynthesis protein B n=1 Tax=Bacillus sp. FJAT-47783 TaxID=2922712 RepID=UPI001FAE5D09